MNRRILFLVMSCNNSDFIEEENIVKETWAKPIINEEHPNVSFLSYRGVNGISEHIDEENHVLFLNSKDGRGDTYIKTIKAFDYLLKNNNFEYIVRTNTSTYVNVQLIVKLINSLSENEISIFGTRIIVNLCSKGCYYFRGNCIILKRCHIETIVKTPTDIRTVDDAAMGYCLTKAYGSEYPKLLKQFPTEYLYGNSSHFSYDYEKYKSVFAYRLKNDGGRSHQLIIEKMKSVHNSISNEKRPFILPQIYNEDKLETFKGFIKISDWNEMEIKNKNNFQQPKKKSFRRARIERLRRERIGKQKEVSDAPKNELKEITNPKILENTSIDKQNPTIAEATFQPYVKATFIKPIISAETTQKESIDKVSSNEFKRLRKRYRMV